MHFFCKCMQVVCRLYASVCRFAKVNPSAIVCNLYTFFSINYFCYIIYIYISIYAKKCNKCNAYYLSSIQGCNVSVRHCKKCKDPVIISISINFFYI